MLQKMVIARTPSTGNHHQSQIFLSARSRALADGAHDRPGTSGKGC